MKVEKIIEDLKELEYNDLLILYSAICNQMGFKKAGRPPGSKDRKRKPSRTYFFFCNVCKKEWETNKERPLRCGYCGSRDWKNG